MFDWSSKIPGFNINGFGGDTANGPSNVMEVRRKHRWHMTFLGRGNGFFTEAELLVLQSASRPSFKFEEPEMHHNQEVTRFAGKQDWEPITLVWYDTENPDVSEALYKWLESVVNMQTIQVALPGNYKKLAKLAIVNGNNDVTEEWAMYGTWPTAFNWQELDYTSTDLLTAEATMRFDRAIRTCSRGVNSYNIVPSCP